MKKFLALLLAAILAAFGCAAVAEEEEEKVLNIFTWEGYFDETTLAQFTEETGIQINYSPFATNEEMLLRLQSNGGSEYDIIVASDYAVQSAASQGLLMELDKSLLTNWDNLNPDYLGQFFDPENTWSPLHGRFADDRVRPVAGRGRDHVVRRPVGRTVCGLPLAD